jgi:hypothetical protein
MYIYSLEFQFLDRRFVAWMGDSELKVNISFNGRRENIYSSSLFKLSPLFSSAFSVDAFNVNKKVERNPFS